MVDRISKKTILIVYDHSTDAVALRNIFRAEFNVQEAEYGSDVVGMVCRDGNIALVIVDVLHGRDCKVPLLNGLRGNSQCSYVPILVIADSTDTEFQLAALDGGADDVAQKPCDSQVLLHRAKAVIERRESAIATEQNKLFALRLHQQDELIRISEIDEKSGIYNRRAFCQKAAALIRNNTFTQYVIFHWDVDRFKVFNDIYGVAAGDSYIEGVGIAIKKMGTRLGLAGHWDADDFVCCIEKSKFDPEKALRHIDKHICQMHREFEFVVRMGIYEVMDSSLEVELMCDRALLALRSTKGNYSSRYAYYSDEMRARLIEEQQFIGEMNSALAEGQFSVYFQPQYNHSDGTLYGAEALARWVHPTKGLIPPGKFIPVFERNGFVSKLDEYIWDRTCAHIRSWIDAGIDVVPISVNISRCDIYNPNLCDCLIGLVRKYDIDISLLRLEITETVYMESPELLLGTVRRLRSMGFFVEMDDFGSGYSSLNTLKDVPVDMLKLDLKFVEQSANDDLGGKILSSIIRMARWIKLEVIAEGVETKTQADYLKSMGCLLMQGYYFAKPMPADAFEILLRNSERSSVDTEGADTDVKGAADFLDASTQTTLLFNSFVGGAAIIEYDGTNVEALRLNDKYFEVIGTTRDEYRFHQIHLQERFEEPYRSSLLEMLRYAIDTGGESEREVRTKPLDNSDKPIWLRVRVRYLSKSGNCFVFYMAIENTTDQIELIEKNRSLSQQLSSIMASVPGGIVNFVADDEGIRMTYFNNSTSDMFGYTHQEFEERFSHDPAVCIYEEDVDSVMEKVESVISGRESILSMKCRTLHRDGKYRWLQFTGHMSYNDDGSVSASAILIDIDNQIKNELLSRKQADEIERQRIFLQTLYDTIPCGILRFSMAPGKQELVSCNETAWKLFGFKSESEFTNITKNSDKDLNVVANFYPDDLPLVLASIQKVMVTSKRVDFDHRIVRMDGTVRWLRTILQKVTANDGTQIIQCVFTDVSQQKSTDLEQYSDALLDIYDEIYEIDVSSDTIRVLEAHTENGDAMETMDSQHSLRQQVSKRVELNVCPDDQQMLTDFLNRLDENRDEGIKSLEYRRLNESGEIRWKSATFIRVGDSRNLACIRDITEKKNSERLAEENSALIAASMERRAEDERNHIFMEANGVMMFDYDPATDVMQEQSKNEYGEFVNNEIDGYLLYVLSGQDVDTEDRQMLYDTINAATEKPTKGEVEYMASRFGNGYRLCRMQYVSVADDNGKVYRIVGMVSEVQDERDRKAIIRNLSRELGRMDDGVTAYDSIAEQIFQLLSDSENTDEAIQFVLATVGSQFSASRAYIIEDSDDGTRCDNTFEWCAKDILPMKAMLQNYEYPDIDGRKYRDLFDESGLLLVSDIRELPKSAFEVKAKQGILSTVQCAIMDGNRFIGYMGFDDCETPRVWTDQQIRVLSMVTKFVGTFLVKERRTQMDMSVSKALMNVVEKNNSIIYVVDPANHELLYGNKHALDIMGMTDARGCCYKAFAGEDQPCQTCPMALLQESGVSTPVEIDRGNMAYKMQAIPFAWKGAPAILVTGTEMTARKAEREAIIAHQEDEERYRIIVEQTGMAVLEWNYRTGDFFKSESFEKYAARELTEQQMLDGDLYIKYISREDSGRLDEFFDSAWSGNSCSETTIRMRMVQGEDRWTRLSGSFVRDESGDLIRTIVTFTDIDEEVRAKLELEQVNDRIQSIIANVPAGIAIFEISDEVRPIFINDRTCNMFGFTRQEYDERIKSGIPINYVPDISYMQANALDLLEAGKTAEIPRLRAFRKDGSTFWLRVVASISRPTENSVMCYSTLIDISDRVESDRRAEWQAERYRLLNEASNVVTFDYDPSTDVVEYSVNMPDKGMVVNRVPNLLRGLSKSKTIGEDSKDGFRNAIGMAQKKPMEGTYDYQANLFSMGFRWYRIHYISVADENGQVFRIVGRMDDIEQMVLEQNEMRRKAQTDGLTGLVNKEAGQSMMEYILRQKQDHRADAVILMDIDDFKGINDTYGHIEGDRILREVGHTLTTLFRSNDIVARFGGDEFLIYLRSIGFSNLVSIKAESVASELRDIIAGGERALTCSIGIVSISNENLDFEQILKQADYALYVSKRLGRNKYTVYDPKTMGTEISSIGQWREN